MLPNKVLPKVVVISGVTGAGKSAVAQSLAHKINGEIIKADSVQLYKGLDILTNKDETGCHLMNEYGPFEIADANTFSLKARAVIKDIN